MDRIIAIINWLRDWDARRARRRAARRRAMPHGSLCDRCGGRSGVHEAECPVR